MPTEEKAATSQETKTESVADTVKTEAVDFSKLPDDQFERVFDDPRIFKHSRFKELNAQAKKAKELEDKQREEQEAALKEQGKFKELLETREKELAEYKASVQKAAVDNKLQQLLFKEGVVDADAALQLIDRSRISQGDDGSVKGLEKAVETLKSSKAYLFGQTTPQPVGSPTNPQPGQVQGTKTFYRSQLTDNEFFKANQLEILAANKAGTIIDDVSRNRPN